MPSRPTRKPVTKKDRKPDLNEPFRQGLKDTFKPTALPGVFKSQTPFRRRPSAPKKGKK